ncbi:hypothetical protein BDW02DRAFT_221251 [Decorospora gaudefroyi]|uniref:RRM domain-containing protein n=1 Tax=Decorospora gaudefroyi TaxID=184978 RepID=A0A6A5KHK5_9PLEO|nr:hypothetical protein BDW02DRAFT_221251 [Decorospora gaudefroyi]
MKNRIGLELSQPAGYDSTGQDVPRKMLAELCCLKQPYGVSAQQQIDDIDDSAAQDDPKKMLAELYRMQQSYGKGAKAQPYDTDTSQHMLAELVKEISLATRPVIVGDHDDSVENPKQMLAELDRLMAGSKQVSMDQDKSEDGGQKVMSGVSLQGTSDMSEAASTREMIERAQAKLNIVIEDCLEGEKQYQAREEEKRLRLRLILTNLAADVDEEAIRFFFKDYRYDIRKISLLAERVPVKGTRTAHVDMYSREAAVLASFEYGFIYALCVHMKLAVE